MKYLIRRAGRPSSGRPALLALMLAAAPAALVAQNDIPEKGVQTAAGGVSGSGAESPATSRTAETVIRKWPKRSRRIAEAMIGKYGEPTRFGESVLAWDDNGPWKRTVVYRGAWPNIRAQDKATLEQSVGYRVPENMIEPLARFDKGIKVDPINNELSSRSDSEKTNYLALNLAEEIITEKRSVDDARDFFRQTMELSKSGKSSRYLDQLIFPVDNESVIAPEYANPENSR